MSYDLCVFFSFLHVLLAHVSVESLHKLFEKLGPYKLRSPELLMIANIRPEAYAHLTPLIADVYSRYTEDQLAVSPLLPPYSKYRSSITQHIAIFGQQLTKFILALLY